MPNLRREILNHKFIYFLLAITLVAGLFARLYRTGLILGFYYDQGRDAKVIWDLIHNGKFFLIGPTTGIAGIFRGPFYYYLIAPFYWLGRGNPVWPAVFLSVSTMVAVVIVYYLGFKFHSRTAGVIAAIIASLSFYMMLASRWLSNPTPMLLLSVVLVWAMYQVTLGKKWAWAAGVAVAGVSLFHFGSAGELFYFLALAVLFVWMLVRNRWNFRKTINSRYLGLCVLAFVVCAAPLAIFDLRHQGILRNNIVKFLVEDRSFRFSFWEVALARLKFVYDTFTVKLFLEQKTLEKVLLAGVGISFSVFLQNLWKIDGVKILLLLLGSLIFGLLFFQGNQGNIYDYYLTGYYLVFVLLFAIVLGEIWRKTFGKMFVLVFLFFFLRANLPIDWYRISAGYDGPGTVVLGNQLQAIDWIYKDAKTEKFNVDVYVPPVIPHAYDYLFKWLAEVKYGQAPTEDRVALLYTLVEDDPPHPDRRDPWLERQNTIGRIEREATFGGIVVQRRLRLK